jgi:predicted outer membrane repeat protein
MDKHTFRRQFVVVTAILVSMLGAPVRAGRVVAWGSNISGQCNVPAGQDYVQVAGGAWHSVALRADGSIAAWGSSENGRNNAPAGIGYVKIACGAWHSLALKSDGSIAAWGNNDGGQCNVPQGRDYVDISAGGWHNLALKRDGSIVAWGYNGQGECLVPPGNDYIAVSAGQDHSLALKSDGSIVGWGSNTDGQSDAPAGNDFVAILAAGRHSAALKANGVLVGWGLQLVGQLNIPKGNDFVSVCGKWNHHLAMRSDGSMVAWGYNTEGQCNIPSGQEYVAPAGGMYHSLAIGPTVVYVDDSATGANNGSSWQDAFVNLQDALAAAQPACDIRVARGTYCPAPAGGDRNASFRLMNGVTIIGGYAGVGSANPNERDIDAFRTNLSGDLNGNDSQGQVDDNSYHVVIAHGIVDQSAVLDGCVVKAGFANRDADANGAGIATYGGSPLIRNCWIIENAAQGRDATGAGIWTYEGSPHVINCRIENNSAVGDNAHGGGFSGYSGNPQITDCSFINNSATGWSARGGGVSNYEGNPQVINCTFLYNVVRGNGQYNDTGGGGMYNYAGNPVVTKCSFLNNRVEGSNGSGGGFWNYEGSPTISRCVFRANSVSDEHGQGGGVWNYEGTVSFNTCLFNGNTAAGSGGALWNYDGTYEIVNCTFSSNAAGSAGGGIVDYAGTVTVTNSILWGNTAAAGGLASEIQTGGDNVTLRCSCIQEYDGRYGTEGNTAQDPLFVNPLGRDGKPGTVDDDLHLLLDSPCVDRGDNNAVVPGMVDLDGKDRIQGRRVDMGAYERKGPAIWYVDDTANGVNDGSSWKDAFVDLQYALTRVEYGDEVWVAGGTYRPTYYDGDRNASFTLRNGVVIKGGFAGWGTDDPDECNTDVYETILSGDLNGDDPMDGFDDNSFHVLTAGNIDRTAVISGFTITGSQGNVGGAMYNRWSSCRVVNCTFTGNTARVSGGVYNEECQGISFVDCSFVENESTDDDRAGSGMFNKLSDVTLVNCLFKSNKADRNSFGCGMYNDNSSVVLDKCSFIGHSTWAGGAIFGYKGSASLTGCVFSENSASFNGGAVFTRDCHVVMAGCTLANNSLSDPYGRGAGVSASGCQLVLKRCLFKNNSAGLGAAVSNEYGVATVSNCIFADNSASATGSAAYNFTGTMTIINSTLVNNSAGRSGGATIFAGIESKTTIANSILWDNHSQEGTEIWLSGDHYASAASISHCDIRGGRGAVHSSEGCKLTWGDGNIDADPLFAGTNTGDYHVLPPSPCIDAGDNSVVDEGATDFAGRERVLGGVVDIGAYEFIPPRVFYVDDDAQGANDGSSWQDAFVDLQNALAAASYGDEIRVGQGVYRPAGTSGPRAASFHLSSGVKVLGSYAGLTQNNPDERDVAKHRYFTRLSGDLLGNDTGGLDNLSRAENVYHVVTTSGVDQTAVLDGFTITGGNAHDNLCSNNDNGGGIFNDAGSPTILDCVITRNVASNQCGYGGGGMFNRNASPHLIRCYFINNAYLHADDDGGGGMCNDSSSPVLTECVFSNNYSGGDGGAMFNLESDPLLTDCQFINNEAAYAGGAVRNEFSSGEYLDCLFKGNRASQSGGAIINELSAPRFYNCLFQSNTAEGAFGLGGAVHNYYMDDPTLIGCTFKQNTAYAGGAMYSYYGEYTLRECVFEGNYSPTYYGGAVYNRAVTSEISQCTFTGNSATGGGAIHNVDESLLAIDRCIFRNNTAVFSGGAIASEQNTPLDIFNCLFAGNIADGGGAIYNDDCHQHLINCTFVDNIAHHWGSVMRNDENDVWITNCIVWGNQGGFGSGLEPLFHGGDSLTIRHSCIQGWAGGAVDGNTDADPMFAADDERYRLSESSPCVDTGDNSVVSEGTLDLAGKDRISGGTVDMGAYEFTLPQVYYVDDTATGANDGSSWQDAFVNLQDALALVVYGDQIRVAQGTYRPGPPDGDRMATFQLVDGAAMQGGFAGAGAPDPDERDVTGYGTILSGDLNANDTADGAMLDDNARNVVTGSGTGSSTVLEGFVITAGVGTYNGSYGGGLYNVGGSPTVTRCVFTGIRGQRGYSGNAIHGDEGSNPLVTSCIFEGGGYSRGLICQSQSVPTVINCTFLDCYWTAIEQYGGTPLVANCVFTGCYWAFFLDYSDADIRNCLFFDNGQDIMLDGGAQPVLTDCIEGIDPMFVDRSGGDYHLQPDSPCIDAGDNSAIEAGWVDLDGNQRIINDAVDMGVYETEAVVIEADLRIIPQVINRNSSQEGIIARVRMPENVAISLIDRSQPLVLLPGEISSRQFHVFEVGRPGHKTVYVFAFFNKADLLDAVPTNGIIELTVKGKLTDGCFFAGSDSVRIMGVAKHKSPPPPRQQLQRLDRTQTSQDNKRLVRR